MLDSSLMEGGCSTCFEGALFTSLAVFSGFLFFLSEPCGNGRKSIRAVRAFFFLALVSVNRAPLEQPQPAGADFLKICRRCLPYSKRIMRV